jgi:hypothetical protein
MFRRLCAVALLAVATPALAGPPWVTIEYPGNPHRGKDSDAFLYVHAYHHQTPSDFPVTGRAEGVVDGQRRVLPLRVTRSDRRGVYAVARQWGERGTWVLTFNVEQGQADIAGAVVTVCADGAVCRVTVPFSTSRDGWKIPRATTAQDVAEAFRQAGVGAVASR